MIKKIFSQCNRCKRIRHKDGTWHKPDEESKDMILNQIICPDCQHKSSFQNEIAENLSGQLLEALSQTPGEEFSAIRELSTMQKTKYESIIKGTILMYLREHDIP